MNSTIKFLIKKAHIILLVFFSLIPLLWLYHRPGILIDGSDTNFPLNPEIWFQRRLFTWQAIANGGSDFSASSAGLFFHFIQVAPYRLGFSLQSIEIISLLFWFSVIVISTYLCAKALLPKKTIPQLVFVSLYVFNTYLFNTWENVKVTNLALVGAIPLGLYVLIKLNQKEISYTKAIILSSITGIILSGTGINPAYFVVFFFIIAIYFISDLLLQKNYKTMLLKAKNFSLVVLIIILVNSFWIVPSINFIFKNIGPFGSIGAIGYTNWIYSLSQDTSILNIFRLQGAWDWYSFDSGTRLPLYIPYAINYFYRAPFIIFSFLIPSLAFISFIFISKTNKHYYLFAAVLLLIGIFMGVGTHTPTGSLFMWLLIKRIPFFSLFRSPWYIFTPMLTICYAFLAGLLLGNLQDITSRLKYKNGLALKLVSTFGILIIAGNLIYNYPLVTGKIFRPSLPDNFLIKFPGYVFDSMKWLSGLEASKVGRFVGYPDDEIERFSWGYNGIDSILGLISPVEVLFSPLNTPDAPLSQILREFYDSLDKKEIDVSKNLAAKLNIGYIFYKEDQASLSPGLPDEIKDTDFKKFGKWIFYKFPGSNSFSKIYFATDIFLGYPSSESSKVVSVIPQSSIVVNPNDTVASNSINYYDEGKVVVAENSQLKNVEEADQTFSIIQNLKTRDLSIATFTFDIPDDGVYQPLLERYKLEDFGILPSKFITADLDGHQVMLTVNKLTNSYVYLDSIKLFKGKHNLSIKVENRNLISGGDFEKSQSFVTSGDAVFSIVGDQNGNHYLSLQNLSSGDVSVKFNVNSFDPKSTYLIKTSYRQIYGEPAASLIGQTRKIGTPLKFDTKSFPSYPEWETYSFYFHPINTDSNLFIGLLGNNSKIALGTKVYYDNLEVSKVFTNDLIFIEGANTKFSTPKIVFNQISPVEYQGTVTDAKEPSLLVFSENYSADWSLTLIDKDNRVISSNSPHFSSNLYANTWYIPSIPGTYKFKIFYKPQNLRKIGVFISTFMILLATAMIFIERLRRRK